MEPTKPSTSGNDGSGLEGGKASKKAGIEYRTLAIDLGTHATSAAYIKGGTLVYVRGEMNPSRAFPSNVAFTRDGQVLVGDKAKEYGLTDPENTITNIKRLVGRKFDEVAKDIPGKIGYKIEKAKNGDCLVSVRDGDGKELKYTPETISSLILKKVKSEAERQNFNTIFQNAVISVPAYFTDSQRQATMEAAQMSNLHVVRVINEPTAASLVYGDTMDDDTKANLVVFDIGGGYFDVSVVSIVKDSKGKTTYRVRGVAGVNFLGGIEFDYSIHKFVLNNLRTNKKYFGKFYIEEEQKMEEQVTIKDRADDKQYAKNDDAQKQQEQQQQDNKRQETCEDEIEVEEITNTTVQATPEILASIDKKIRALAEAKKIELCSGTTGKVEIEIPNIVPGLHFKETLTMARFVQLNMWILDSIQKELNSVLNASRFTKDNITAVLLVGGSTYIPCVKNLVTEYFGKEPITLSPEEDVVLGLAMYAGCCDGNRRYKNLELKDVMAFNIGIRDKDDKMIVIVPRCTSLPFSNKDEPHIIQTYEKEQKIAKLMIFEGNSDFVKNNVKLGEFCLRDMLTKKGQRTPVEIRAEVSDRTGVIKLTAKEIFGNKEKVVFFDKGAGYGNSEKEQTEKEQTETKNVKETISHHQQLTKERHYCNTLKHELQASCIKFQEKLDSATKEKENVDGFVARREEFKRYANETINWLRGPLSKRIKIEELNTKTQELTDFYKCTLENMDWVEPAHPEQLNAAIFGKGEANVEVLPVYVKPLPVPIPVVEIHSSSSGESSDCHSDDDGKGNESEDTVKTGKKK